MISLSLTKFVRPREIHDENMFLKADFGSGGIRAFEVRSGIY